MSASRLRGRCRFGDFSCPRRLPPASGEKNCRNSSFETFASYSAPNCGESSFGTHSAQNAGHSALSTGSFSKCVNNGHGAQILNLGPRPRRLHVFCLCEQGRQNSSTRFRCREDLEDGFTTLVGERLRTPGLVGHSDSFTQSYFASSAMFNESGRCVRWNLSPCTLRHMSRSRTTRSPNHP